MTERLRVGVSTCLLGEKVRYDGGHKLNRYVRDTLGVYFDFVPVCPEFELGLGVPREAMRLVGDPADPRLVTNKTGVDLTGRMKEWSARRVEALAAEELCGFIFKSKSPSSGMERVKVYTEAGMPAKSGSGLFARAYMDRFPNIPVEEEGRLNDPPLRENFIERVFTSHRWRRYLLEDGSRGGLVRFHTAHKLLIRAHSLLIYREMGRLVAAAAERTPEVLAEEYETLLMGALKLHATKKKHADVLMHCMGHFKRVLERDEKQEMMELVDGYKAGHLPLIVPITLVNHFVRKYGEAYLAGQVYLKPHPMELQLRNHV
jgi:uncharacterized protein YbgA (DUF1722 family)/uncharacterized protein YbbK (DUF523 family)